MISAPTIIRYLTIWMQFENDAPREFVQVNWRKPQGTRDPWPFWLQLALVRAAERDAR
jgi:hypothetical protein